MSLDGIRPGGVLTLDLSGTVGFAIGRLEDSAPSFGEWQLPRIGGEGSKYAGFDERLQDTLEALEPSAMILEGHLPLPAMNNVAAMRQAVGLRAIAYAAGYRFSCAVSEIDVLTVRREVMGIGRFSKDQVKNQVVAFCRQRGWKVPNHHAADACLIWLWHKQRMTRRPGPLFLIAAD